MRLINSLVFLMALSVLSSCGYTNKIVLPYDGAETIAVNNFRNQIPPQNILTYVAGLESDVTQDVIDELAKDGNLRVVDDSEADLLLEGDIVGYEQTGYRFDRFEQVSEFRLFVVVNLKLVDQRTGQVIWQEKNFSGDAQYFIDGARQTTEEIAAEEAIDDLAEKIVNRVVEHW